MTALRQRMLEDMKIRFQSPISKDCMSDHDVRESRSKEPWSRDWAKPNARRLAGILVAQGNG